MKRPFLHTKDARKEFLKDLNSKLIEHRWRIFIFAWIAVLYWRLMPGILLAVKSTKLMVMWNFAFNAVANDIYLNILLLLCLLIACSVFIYRRCKDYYFSTWYFLGAIFGIWAIGYDNLWRFIPIWGKLDYSWLLYGFFATVIVAEFVLKGGKMISIMAARRELIIC